MFKVPNFEAGFEMVRNKLHKNM